MHFVFSSFYLVDWSIEPWILLDQAITGNFIVSISISKKKSLSIRIFIWRFKVISGQDFTIL